MGDEVYVSVNLHSEWLMGNARIPNTRIHKRVTRMYQGIGMHTREGRGIKGEERCEEGELKENVNE